MSANAESRDAQFVGVGRAPAPLPVTARHEPGPAAAALGTVVRRRGFSAWLYDVHEVQGLCLTVALRYQVAAEGHERVRGDELQLVAWEQEWAAAAAELEQAAGGGCDELIQLDRWTYHFIRARNASRLRMLGGLWQRWGDRLGPVRSRDHYSISVLYSEFDKAWHAAAWRPRTGEDWLCLRHYDYALSRALRLIKPQLVGYFMPAKGSYTVTTRARRLHARGDLWGRILPRSTSVATKRAAPDVAGLQPPRPSRGRKPPRRLVEQVLAEYDAFGIG